MVTLPVLLFLIAAASEALKGVSYGFRIEKTRQRAPNKGRY
jgi:hypothetical protein